MSNHIELDQLDEKGKAVSLIVATKLEKNLFGKSENVRSPLLKVGYAITMPYIGNKSNFSCSSYKLIKSYQKYKQNTELLQKEENLIQNDLEENILENILETDQFFNKEEAFFTKINL